MRVVSSHLIVISLLMAAAATTRIVHGFTIARLPRSLIVTRTTTLPRVVGSVQRPCNNHNIHLSTTYMQTIVDESPKNDVRPVQEKQENHHNNNHINLSSIVVSLAALALPLVTMALPAHAAGTAGVVQNALVAYVHYASILVCVGAVMAQRCMVRANMTLAQEDDLFQSEVVLGVATIALLVSGFLRIDLDKGLGFYSHEPVFWLKIVLSGVWGGSSLFPSTIIFQRYMERKSKDPTTQTPISTALAARLNQVLNAELTALLFIPLTATLMARGVGYIADFPWPVGVALSAVTWLGLSYKYGKDALTWKDDDPEEESTKDSISATSTSPEWSKK